MASLFGHFRYVNKGFQLPLSACRLISAPLPIHVYLVTAIMGDAWNNWANVRYWWIKIMIYTDIDRRRQGVHFEKGAEWRSSRQQEDMGHCVSKPACLLYR